MELTKQERKRLIAKISDASGIAQYALIKKMTDEQILAAVEHLEVLQLVKDASNYNRHCQGQKTKEVNDELKEVKSKLQKFLDIDESEIVKTGKWLMSALSKKSSDRQQVLLEKELVHKEDYNEIRSGMEDTITTILSNHEESTEDAKTTISLLEQRIDSLKNQLSKVQDYISNNYGPNHWKAIKDTFKIN